MGKSDGIRLQIQTAAYGQEGLDRVASHTHPRMEGVRWLVSVQSPDGDVEIPLPLQNRDDFDIIISRDRGVALNRNHALDFPCDSELILFSDDDVDFDESGLRAVIQAFEEYPEADLICFRYTCRGKYIKPYGKGVFPLGHTPFGWYPSMIELACRRKSGPVRFNEKVGPGSGYVAAGEDSIWYYDMLRKGARGVGYPADICRHDDGLSTGELRATEPDFLKAYGACMTHIKPATWFPRLLLHAWRSPIPFFKCLRQTLNGAIYAYRNNIF